jgi:hypothetical protein
MTNFVALWINLTLVQELHSRAVPGYGLALGFKPGL